MQSKTLCMILSLTIDIANITRTKNKKGWWLCGIKWILFTHCFSKQNVYLSRIFEKQYGLNKLET